MNEAVRSTKLQDMPMLIGGKLVGERKRPLDGIHQSGDRGSHRPHAARHREGRRRGGRSGGKGAAGMGGAAGRKARRISAQAVGRHGQARRRDPARRGDGYRQHHLQDARRRRQGDRPAQVLRRPRLRDEGPERSVDAGQHALHRARALWRGGAHHSVQPSDQLRRLAHGGAADRRQHHRREAVGAEPAVGVDPGGDRRGSDAAGRRQHRHRLPARKPATRWCVIRGSSASPSSARCRPAWRSSARRRKSRSSTSRSNSAARTR